MVRHYCQQFYRYDSWKELMKGTIMKKTFLLVSLLAIACLPIAYSQTIYSGVPPFAFRTTSRVVSIDRSDSCHTLDFEGIAEDSTVLLGSFYEPWGYYFSDNSLVGVSCLDGGDGNFTNNPSGSSTLFWMIGDSTFINIPEGFVTAFSFYYCGLNNALVQVFSELDGEGTLLASMDLPRTPSIIPAPSDTVDSCYYWWCCCGLFY